MSLVTIPPSLLALADKVIEGRGLKARAHHSQSSSHLRCDAARRQRFDSLQQ